jgi:hypothetical protein
MALRFRASVALGAVLAALNVGACGSSDDSDTTTTTTTAGTGATGATGPTAPSGASLSRGAAIRVVQKHYRDLNRGRLGPAWEDFSGQLKSELGPYSKFVDGYSLTEGTYLQSVRGTSLTPRAVRVAVDFDADNVDVCGDHVRQRYDGTWVVTLDPAGPILADADIEFVTGGDPVRDVSECPAPPEPKPPPPRLKRSYGSDYPDPYLPPSDAGGFCATHDCIPNFDNGSGYVVQCEDGTWSHSGGIQGACSWHGGVRGP